MNASRFDLQRLAESPEDVSLTSSGLAANHGEDTNAVTARTSAKEIGTG
ncbi:hypothetical protein PF003_g5028 [Phytophthora fragariae]|nr:hypothetical protein PF003_g5028 [Phytophthora fragariae]